MTELIDKINEAIDRLAVLSEDQPSDQQVRFNEICALLADFGDQVDKAISQIKIVDPSLDAIDDLPQEVIDMLHLPKQLGRPKHIADIIDAHLDQTANLNQIIAGMYRQYNIVLNSRKHAMNRVQNAIDAGLVYRVPKRRGVYSTWEGPDGGERDYDSYDMSPGGKITPI